MSSDPDGKVPLMNHANDLIEVSSKNEPEEFELKPLEKVHDHSLVSENNFRETDVDDEDDSSTTEDLYHSKLGLRVVWKIAMSWKTNREEKLLMRGKKSC